MRTPTLLALALAIAAVPGVAPALDWTASAALEYVRRESAFPSRPRLVEPRLDVDLDLRVDGSLGPPGWMLYALGGGWRRVAYEVAGAESRQSSLTYDLRTRLFTDPRSPVTLSASAARLDDDFEVSGLSGGGNVLVTSYGADAAYRAAGRPAVTAGYGEVHSDRSGDAFTPSERTVRNVRATAGYGTGVFSLSGGYTGSFSEGTFANDDYDEHRADLRGSVNVTRRTTLLLQESYFQRRPTGVGAFLARQELNQLSGILSHVAGLRDTQSVRYQYLRAIQERPGLEDGERASHQVGWLLDHTLSTAWRLRATADLSLLQDRTPGQRSTASGQTVTATATWTRERGAGRLELRAGPQLGLLDPAQGGLRLGYGATAGGTASRTFGALASQASYDVTYQSDLFGLDGWSLRQVASGRLDRPVGTASLRGSLLLSSERRESAFGIGAGRGATRSVLATVGWRWRKLDTQLDASLQSNVVGALSGGDGLIIPASFDSHTRSLQAQASWQLYTGLSLLGALRATATDLPDRPRRDDLEARAALTYGYGGLTFSLEDRFVTVEGDGGTTRTNEVFVRAARAFGSRY